MFVESSLYANCSNEGGMSNPSNAISGPSPCSDSPQSSFPGSTCLFFFLGLLPRSLIAFSRAFCLSRASVGKLCSFSGVYFFVID